MTLQGIDNLRNQYDTYNLRLLSIIGLWPYQEKSDQFLNVCFIIFVLVLAVLLQIYVLIFTDLKLQQIIDILQLLLPTLCFACCYCNILYKLPTIKMMFDSIKSNWVSLANEQEEIVMKNCGKQTKLWSLAITWLFYLYAALLIFPSILNLVLYFNGVTNTTGIIVPIFETYVSEKNARILFMSFFQLVMVCVVSTLGIANYATMISFLHHVRALFMLTTLKIDRPFKENCYSSTSMRSFVSIDKEQEWIINVIKCYNDSLNFVDLIKDVFGRMYLIETFIALLLIIVDYLYLFQMFTTTKSINEMLRDCIYIFGTLIMIYVYCYLGQKIIDDNTAVFIKCCHVPFYSLSVRTQKVLLMLILKTMQPCTYSFTKMIVTSHELYANLVRTCFSYAMVFYNIL